MLDYAIHFYYTHKVFFYILLLVLVILEGPVIILSLSFLAVKFHFSFLDIYIFAFLWDFLWDLWHFLFWRFFSVKILKKDFSLVQKIDKKLKNHSLLDKLIVIKYTPPITSLGLIYLWFSKISFKNYIKNSFYISVFSAFFITFIWYNFWYLFKDKDNLVYLIFWSFLSFVVFYFLFKIITKYIIKKIYDS